MPRWPPSRCMKAWYDHPDTADSLNNLAILLSRGKYAEAEPLLQARSRHPEKALGKDHPDTANGLNNLAALSGAGEVRGGRTALQARSRHPEKALGKDHPDTAHSLNNLAILYDRRGSTRRPNRSSSALSTSVRRRWAKIIRTPP